MLQKLEQLGASAYSATRATRMTGEFWNDKTSMLVTIGYLAIIPADRDITEILVPRRLSRTRMPSMSGELYTSIWRRWTPQHLTAATLHMNRMDFRNRCILLGWLIATCSRSSCGRFPTAAFDAFQDLVRDHAKSISEHQLGESNEK